MALSATVADITTCTKTLPGDPKVDIVTLHHGGKAYAVETPIGQLTVGQTTSVEAVVLDGVNMFLRLAS
jgi:hypothetical protein